ncbi:hypothetical protein HK100_010817 [Physocladia obscura]|uniref:BZIP domain-containing protein n=1 Tax=Physocladia obscura TaxID=109957 RepID=A0AAD5T274_9FUNG|nr:hypothetical protein HK100_010817 [Physocladia obscura]
METHNNHNQRLARKALLNREAQRALRERRAKRLHELEARVAELSAQNSALSAELEVALNRNCNCSRGFLSGSFDRSIDHSSDHGSDRNQAQRHTLAFSDSNFEVGFDELNDELNSNGNDNNNETDGCLSCAAERLKNAICMRQIRTLETALRKAKTKGISSLASSATALTGSVPINPFPPAVNFNLQDFAFLDRFLDSCIPNSPNLATPAHPELTMSSEYLYGPIEAKTKVSNNQDARKALVKYISVFREAFTKVTLLDYPKFNEIFSIFYERNANHQIHFSKLFAPKPEVIAQLESRPTTRPIPFSAKTMQTQLKQIPSFDSPETGAIIDQLCNYWVYTPDQLISEDFFYFEFLLYQLEIACKNFDDRTRLWQAFDALWKSDYRVVDQLLMTVGWEG